MPDELQLLAAELLLQTKKYETLTFLCHHNIIKGDQKVSKLIFKESQKNGQEYLQTLGLDMAYHNMNPKEFLKLLLKESKLREAKRYLRTNYERM